MNATTQHALEATIATIETTRPGKLPWPCLSATGPIITDTAKNAAPANNHCHHFMLDGLTRTPPHGMLRNCSAAADEVDDFVGVVWLDGGFGPSGSGENVAIAFDGDALDVDAEMLDKLKDVQA